MRPIHARLRDCIPLLDYGLIPLVELFSVEETRAIPTAAVPLGGSPRLLLNPDFVAANCRTDHDLAMLVLHELHHVLLGHTRLFKRMSPAHNFAFDVVINAMLCRRNPAPEWTALFRRMYAYDRYPELLLRPPDGFPGHPIFGDEIPRSVRRLVRELYYSPHGTFHEVFEALVEAGLVAEAGVPLLGSHGEDARGLEAGDNPTLFAAVRRIVERWPQPVDPRVGRSMQEATGTMSHPPADVSPVEVVRAALLAAARAGTVAAGPRGRPPTPADLAWPTPDRRAFALAASGQRPLLYRGTLHGPPRPNPITPVDVYVDVSGSTHAWIGTMLDAIRGCRALIAPTIYTFDLSISRVTGADLLARRTRFGGGTSGAAVTEDIVRRRSRSAVVLTDGYVGPIPSEHVAACKRARLQVVLTPGGYREDLAPVATAFHQLPQVTP